MTLIIIVKRQRSLILLLFFCITAIMADLTATAAIEDVEDVEMVEEEKRGATEKEDDRNEDIGEKEKKETKDGQVRKN